MVVGEVRREAEGNREQPAALRRQIMSRCVGAAHDGGELFERRILDAVNSQKRVERASIALMGEFDALDIEGRGARFRRDRKNLARRHIDELCAWIDESLNEPRAGDAIDLRPLARHPFVCAGAEFAAGGQAALLPAGDAAFEVGSGDAGRRAARRPRLG